MTGINLVIHYQYIFTTKCA